MAPGRGTPYPENGSGPSEMRERERAYTLARWEKMGLTPWRRVCLPEKNRAAPPGEREDRWVRTVCLQTQREETAEMSALS